MSVGVVVRGGPFVGMLSYAFGRWRIGHVPRLRCWHVGSQENLANGSGVPF